MSVRAVILAGQRPGPDALCDHAGVVWKADIPVGGVPMVERVAAALRDAGLAEPFVLSGYPHDRDGFERREGGTGPADSALLALEGGSFPALLTTCDHALLSGEIVTEFLAAAEATGADFCVGLATEAVVQAGYPQTSRTYLRFRDNAVSGCNLFYLRREEGLEAIRFWRTAQDFRKDPLKLARTLGVGIGLKYASGRLGLQDAFDAVGKRLGITAAPVLLSQAEAAIDVDKPSDLELVEAIVAAR